MSHQRKRSSRRRRRRLNRVQHLAVRPVIVGKESRVSLHPVTSSTFSDTIASPKAENPYPPFTRAANDLRLTRTAPTTTPGTRSRAISEQQAAAEQIYTAPLIDFNANNSGASSVTSLLT